MSPTLAGAVVWLEASGRGPVLAVDGGAVADDDAAAAAAVGFGSLNQSRQQPLQTCV